MKLKLMVPSQVLIDQEVTKVVAESENGEFCLLPRHVDFVAALVPGILSFSPAGASEEFVAIDQGMLVKCGPEVLVSTREAARGPDLGVLRRRVEEQFLAVEDRERLSRSALAKLEANFVRRFMELERHGG
jgi:F-type H+-transporting ATPase subunit epsilon